MKLSKVWPGVSALLSLSSVVLSAAGFRNLSPYVAVISFIMASASFSLGAQILSIIALAVCLISLGSGAVLWLAVAVSLALVGLIARLVLSDVKSHASRNLVVGGLALMVGVPLAAAPSLLSRPLTLVEPLAVVLVSVIASYALGLSYALGRGLRTDVAPVGLTWLRGLSRRMFDKLVKLLTWLVLTALITRALVLAGIPAVLSTIIAVLVASPILLVAGRYRTGLVTLLLACAAASIALLKREDIVGLGNTLRFIEEVIRSLAW